MKKIIILIAAFLFTYTGFTQERINWLNISEFEKALIEGEKKCFIFIEDDKSSRKESEKTKTYISRHLENKRTVKYINKNFICYKFNPSLESLQFLGKHYRKIEEKGNSFHEFTNFLTTSDKNLLPIIVLRDQEFNLFRYQAMPAANKNVQKLIDAGKRKMPMDVSVLPFIQHTSSKWSKALTYFGSDSYKEIDLESFIEIK